MLVLFGAGNLGRRVLAECKAKKMRVDYFSDNNRDLWYTEIDGVEVLPPEHLYDKALDDLYEGNKGPLVVVTIFNGAVVRKQLRDLGFPKGQILSCAEFILSRNIHLVDFGIAAPVFYKKHHLEISRAFEVLSDSKSEEVFEEQIRWRKLGMDYDLSPHDPWEEIYFPPFIKQIDLEVYIDCGAYTGDTIHQFRQWHKGPSHIVAFEPVMQDPLLPQVSWVRAGVGKEAAKETFSLNGAGSTRNAKGDIDVSIVRLDDCSYVDGATFIKMDIEGMEPEAIEGAHRLITMNKPVMAVCLYHRPDHLWTVPLMLHEKNPKYKIFIRRYADDCAELVCYAVPPERLQ